MLTCLDVFNFRYEKANIIHDNCVYTISKGKVYFSYHDGSGWIQCMVTPSEFIARDVNMEKDFPFLKRERSVRYAD